ncbi:MAG TPA: EVE domain-containing protein [Dehalococcoidia bacterium]|jgi:predicted RNA-binding protein|nr:EVE domain-containing protein [Dehalococcoidia bacterium]
MPKYWLISTTPENFEIDRQNNFAIQGFHRRIRRLVEKVKPGDKFVIYVTRLQKIGAICVATSPPYFDDKNKIWSEEDEIWPYRFETHPLLTLSEEELLDVKKIVSSLSFITAKQKATNWGLAFHQSLRTIPEEDFDLIESEMRKRILIPTPPREGILSEQEAKQAIMELPLEKTSLHDRIGEMLETIGSRMGYNAYTGHKVTPEHAVELDVAWLRGKNPEVAIEIQIGGNIIEAKDKLAQARKFNYRKVIMVMEESQLDRLNAIVKFDELIDWMDAWSIQAVYKLYTAGMSFLDLYERLTESRYKKKTEVEVVMG